MKTTHLIPTSFLLITRTFLLAIKRHLVGDVACVVVSGRVDFRSERSVGTLKACDVEAKASVVYQKRSLFNQINHNL